MKGGLLLLDALPAVARRLGRPIRLTMTGGGPDRAAWEAAAHKYESSEVSIRIPGWLTRAELGGVLSEADLLVMPSIWPEPFGLAGPEAGLHGVPSVAFAVGGIPEWLNDGVNGHLAAADPPSSIALSDAIVRALADPEHHAELRKGAQRA